MAEHSGIEITWIDGGRQATQPANPLYPKGMDVTLADGAKTTCRIELSYPAPRIGHWRLTCGQCGARVAVTAAGRSDDPRSVTIRCIPPEERIPVKDKAGPTDG